MEKAPSRPSPGTACVTAHVYGGNGKETLVLYGVISLQHLRAAAPALPPTQTSSAGAGSPCGLPWCCPSVGKCPSSPLLTHLSCKTLPGSHATTPHSCLSAWEESLVQGGLSRAWLEGRVPVVGGLGRRSPGPAVGLALPFVVSKWQREGVTGRVKGPPGTAPGSNCEAQSSQVTVTSA